MRLYRLRFSTNVERVTLALAHKGLQVDSIWIEPDDRSLIERISGQRLVPVLENEGRVVVDSTAILRYLEQHYPDPPLFPRAEARRAEMELYIDWFNRVVKHPPNALEAELGRGRAHGSRVDLLAAEMQENLDRHEALLSGREYLFGDAFTAADCAAFPFLKYALAREPDDDEVFHRILSDYQSVDGRPRLEAWIRRVDARPRA
jgi:glutathione S-transferase